MESNNETLNSVVGWLCDGLSPAQVAQRLRRETAGETAAAQVAVLIAEARSAIAGRVAVNRDFHRGVAVIRLDKLYAMAVAKDDPCTALAVQQELTRLLDLEA